MILFLVIIPICLWILYQLFVIEIPDYGLSRTVKKLQKKYDIYISGIGKQEDKINRGKLQEMTIYLDRHGKPLNQSEARALIVEVTQEILNNMNRNEKLRDALSPYPFTPKNLYIVIFNYMSKTDMFIYPDIAIVKESRGTVLYATIQDQKYNDYKTTYEEPYEEAVAILAREQQESANNNPEKQTHVKNTYTPNDNVSK